MSGLFSRLKGKDGKPKSKKGAAQVAEEPPKPQWEDAWARKTVEPDEVQELIRYCTEELKARGMTSTATCSGSHPYFLPARLCYNAC